MTNEEKIDRLTSILSAAISELYESAEDWYREEIPGLLGTDEDELAQLGIRI